ncbi:EPIDERMAL PATTERNING FACTOR-like protein 9 [Senna tora]|uniref:EPIDERMAL PATTERNING FACTOR-like protein 9 n=1 Tax=Senna tora TaxID=362788 RepID=A0A834WM16_9FABA|nr:EPIDERMAL PATTERNING FACTOR-like protein 9 [Senna tora]
MNGHIKLMATHKARRMGSNLLLLLFIFAFAAQLIQGIETEGWASQSSNYESQRELSLQDWQGRNMMKMRNSRRLMIGSTAPTCTYNECRGCKYKCSAQQVPVEGNDPVNSPYHYRCVCHR